MIHPDDAGWVAEAWTRAMGGVVAFREELRIRDRDGEYRWVVSHAVPAIDEDGAVTRWYGTVVPIDARRSAEEAVARSAQRRAVLDRLAAAFAESLEFERTARAVVSAMIEDFADFAFVDVFDADARLERAAVAPGRLSSEGEPFRTFAPPPEAVHHPINVVLRSGKPHIVELCDDAWFRATTWSEEHYVFASRLPIASIAYVPMIAAGEAIGVLTFGSVIGTGRRFSPADLEDAEEVARRAAVALANARLYRDLAASEARYRGIIDTAQEGVWIVDAAQRTRYVNARMTEMLGYEADELYGRATEEFTSPEEREELQRSAARLRRGEGFRGEWRLGHRDGHIVWVTVAASPLFDSAGAYTGSLGMFTDITDRKAVELRREIVGRASDVLNGSLDLDALLGRFADLLVAEVADEVTIALHPGRAVVRRRAAVGGDAPSLEVPLRYRDAELGSVTLRARVPFQPDAISLLDELASRASIAIENAQLYEREHRVAMTLQRAMLPAVLPQVEGLAFDAVYYPGATEAEIGGDWYDAIALADGRVVVSIGDVTGRGLTAAVIMGRMRQAIETLATYETDPVRLLDAADRVLRRTYPDAIVTALVALVDPAARTMAYATAGHPAPVVRFADASTRPLPGRGLPLGLRDGHRAPTTTVALPPGAMVVFFTDGLVESTRDIAEGEHRLSAALRDEALAEMHAPAAALVARVLDDGIVRDDVAVLTLRLAGGSAPAQPWTFRWRFDPRDRECARDVRETLVEALALYGRDIDVPAAELVFGELLGNAVRYAPGRVELELGCNDPAAPVLRLIDQGPGYALPATFPAPLVESGRGLYLISRLTRELNVTAAPERGAVTSAVLLPRA